MTNRSVTRNAYLVFLADMHALLQTKKQNKIRERALELVKHLLTILETLAPRRRTERDEMISAIKDILDRSPCEDFQQLLRGSLRRLQGRPA